MADVEIEVLAVIAATIAAMVIGFVWFTVLSEQWMAAVGKTREEIAAGPQAPTYAITTLLQVVTAVCLAVVCDWARADTLAEGLVVGALAWLGFVATRKGISALFEDRKPSLQALDVGHDLLVLLAMGAILALWN